MAGRIDLYLRELTRKKDEWFGGPCANYAIAYANAYDSFVSTLKAEEEYQKRQAELFLLAASVATSTIMIAAFASASLRTLAGRAALQVICANNLNRTFNALYAVSNNKAAMFAIGALLDGAKSAASKKITEVAQKLMMNSSNIISSSPLIKKIQIDQFIYLSSACAQEIAAIVQDDTRMSGDERNAIMDHLERAPIFNPPAGSIDYTLLAKRIELAMFMNRILESDYLVDVPFQANITGSSPAIGFVGFRRSPESPIQQLPSAKDYPRPKPGERYPVGIGAHQRVRYEEQGDTVKKHIDSLHKDIFGKKPFYDGFPTYWSSDGGPNPQLIKAEQTLYSLADKTRPLRIDTVRV
ncbi:hypothetical protein GE253_09770 [Niveispirillum sp. SYP-B3756]|uniref:hypothetical protein n=1 Tax=Niveispirillum sp. SYP-B3756 TaxID=2662178 RepID=UPI001291D77A|nr:hypothetical protein [Niveispirillum sp. SYP-B3756]MQP65626.1 hypothetical protein [Niveispirillum sp. SYP-B3756]